jgi:hypothetical protein
MESINSELFGIEILIEKSAENVDIVDTTTKYEDVPLVFSFRLRVVQQDFFFNYMLDLFHCVRLVCQRPVEYLNGIEAARHFHHF